MFFYPGYIYAAIYVILVMMRLTNQQKIGIVRGMRLLPQIDNQPEQPSPFGDGRASILSGR
jgi:hypothetical protein